MVYTRADPARVNHLLTHGFERQRSEVFDERSPVQLLERLHCIPNAIEFARGRAVADEVPFGEPQIGGKQFVDGHVDSERLGAVRATLGNPLGDNPVVFRPAQGSAVGTEVMVTAGKGNDGLTGRSMAAVLGQRMRQLRHCERLPVDAQNGNYRFAKRENAALPNVGRYRNLLLRLYFGLVGAAGTRLNRLYPCFWIRC
jgi:hypothetical protein